MKLQQKELFKELKNILIYDPPFIDTPFGSKRKLFMLM